MPCDYSKYPGNLKTEIRPTILVLATMWNDDLPRCEWCSAIQYQPHPITGIRVILTVAHFDHNIEHNSYGNLVALCKRCHIRYDAQQHAKTRAIRKEK